MAALSSNSAQRVVVADDSRLMRRILSDALGRQGFDVVATAADGDEALAACNEHRPDALTLDLHMPGLDGLGVLRALRAGKAEPVPVVVVSAFSPAHGARAVDALAEGAFDLVAKPAMGESMADFTTELSARSTTPPSAASRVPAVRGSSPPRSRRGRRRGAPAPLRSATRKFVLIASSTGGPKALGELIPKLPSPLGTGSMIVQHMPAGFTASLATRLDGASKLTVREAVGGESMDSRHMYLAPGGAHLRMGEDRKARLSDDAPLGGLRPRADYTIADAAKLYGNALAARRPDRHGQGRPGGRARRQEGRRPRAGRGRVHLRRLRHAARRRRGRPRRRDPAAARTARRDRPGGRRMSLSDRPRRR